MTQSTTITETKTEHETDIQNAHKLLEAGRRSEAFALVEEILRKDPANFSAQAVRDRIYTEENSERLATETEADREEGDESILVPILMAVIGVASGIAGVILSIKYIMLGSKVGFGTAVTAHTELNPNVGHYPVQMMFMFPIAMFVIMMLCFAGCRRYMRNR